MSRPHFTTLVLLTTLLVPCLAFAELPEPGPDGYIFTKPVVPLPDKPARAFFTDPELKTPEGKPNPCADWTNARLKAALEGRLKKFWPKQTHLEASQFLNWAVWGWLSHDSDVRHDDRLIPLMQAWIDKRLHDAVTEPTDEKKKKKWVKGVITDSWGFHNYSIPAIDLGANKNLAEKIGTERVKAFRQLVVNSVRHQTKPENWNNMLARSDQYVNMGTHPMAVYIHGWILTGDRKLLHMAENLVAILARDVMPHGTYPYRKFGGAHLETEVMYYHAINNRALYMYWWATDSPLAEKTFKASAPYYPMNMEPPYFVEGNTAIWWKDSWRTFWPQHIAMVAAVARDGENATIATRMAKDNTAADRFDLVLGCHAYQQMGLADIEPVPRRNNYYVVDEDIGGLRGRHGRFGINFSSRSYHHTIAGGLVVSEDEKYMDALRRAMPYIRVAPITKARRTDPNWYAIGKDSVGAATVIEKDFAVGATIYTPYDEATTWRPVQKSGPWQVAQVWLYTPESMVGLMTQTATATHKAYEVMHLFRFIINGKDQSLKPTQDDRYDAGLLRMIVHGTNLEHRIIGLMRRVPLNPKNRKDWQLNLSDSDRSAEQAIQDTPPKGQPKPEVKLPSEKTYETGHNAWSLTELGPKNKDAADEVTLLSQTGIVSFRVRRGETTWHVGYNVSDQDGPAQWTVNLPGVNEATIHKSWTDPGKKPVSEKVAVKDGKLTIDMNVKGVLVVVTQQ